MPSGLRDIIGFSFFTRSLDKLPAMPGLEIFAFLFLTKTKVFLPIHLFASYSTIPATSRRRVATYVVIISPYTSLYLSRGCYLQLDHTGLPQQAVRGHIRDSYKSLVLLEPLRYWDIVLYFRIPSRFLPSTIPAFLNKSPHRAISP